MEVVDPKTVKGIKNARELILDLQKRLFKCEEVLDDLTRAVEIAVVSGQYQLIHGFLQDAQEALVDRLTLPEPSQEDLDKPLTIIEDDRKVHSQPA
jgi:hypothetical protein